MLLNYSYCYFNIKGFDVASFETEKKKKEKFNFNFYISFNLVYIEKANFVISTIFVLYFLRFVIK